MIALSAAILTAGLVVAAALLRPASPLPVLPSMFDSLMIERQRDKVVVTLKTGASFSGVLFAADDRSLVLRQAQLVSAADGISVPVDGELVVARAEVEYLQRP